MHSSPQPHGGRKYIDALLRNDTVLLNELYCGFYPAVKAMVVKYRGNATDADDVFQEALTAVCIKAKKGDADAIGNFCSYLYGTCQKIWMTQQEKNRRMTALRQDIGEYPGTDNGSGWENDQWRKARLVALETTIGKLPPRSKAILQLRRSGKSIHEIAGLLNLTNGYVRKKICTTVKGLRASMGCRTELSF